MALTHEQRARLVQQIAEMKLQTDAVSARIADMEAAQANATAPVEPYVSAATLGLPSMTSAPPLRPVGAGRPAWQAAMRREPLEPPRLPLSPSAFPTAPNAPAVPMAMPGIVAEDLSRLTTRDAVASGEYAQHRQRLLGLVGMGQGHGFTPSGLLATGPQRDSADTPRHLLAARPDLKHVVSSAVQQPHGHVMTGPMPPLMQAKVERARLFRKANGR